MTPPPYAFRQLIEVELTVRNNGPDITSGGAPLVVPPVTIENWMRVDDRRLLPVTVRLVDGNLCSVEYVPLDPLPGEREGVISIFYLDHLAPGQARTCRVALELFEATPSPVVFSASSARDVDPLPDDNEVALVLSVGAAPAPLGGVAVLAGLLLALWVAAIHRFERRSRATRATTVDCRR